MSFASQEGFSSVELMCWPPGRSDRRYAGVTHLDAASLSAGSVVAVQELLGAHQIAISGLGYYPNPLSADVTEAEVATSHLRKVIDAAAVLEVGLVNTFIGREPALSVDANWPRFLEIWKPLIGYAEARGVKVAIENCPMLFDADQWPGGKNLATVPAIWRRMFDAIPSPNFGLNFDPSHLIWQQVDYLAPIGEFKDRIFHVHAKDARIDRGAFERTRAAVVSQALAHAQDPRYGRRPLGSFLRRLERCGLPGPRGHRSRGSGV